MLTQRRMFSVLLLVSVFMVPAMSFAMGTSDANSPAASAAGASDTTGTGAPAASTTNTTSASSTSSLPASEVALNAKIVNAINAPLDYLLTKILAASESNIMKYPKAVATLVGLYAAATSETVQTAAANVQDQAKRALGLGVKAKCEKACAKTTCSKAVQADDEDDYEEDDCE